MSASLGRPLFVLALAVAMVGGAAQAHAAPRAAALVPTLRPTSNPELRDRFHDAVTRGLTAGGADAIQAGEVRMRLGSSPEMLACSGPGPCAARVSMALRTDETVATEIVIGGKDYTIRLKLIDAAGREVAAANDECDICTQHEAEETVTKVAQKLLASAPAPAPAPAPTTTTTPPTTTPAPTPAPATTPPPATQPLHPPPAGPTATPAPAQATTPPAKTTERKRFPWRPVAIASLAAGVVGIAIGAPLIAIDGNPTCTAPAGQDPHKVCKDVYNTAGGGGVLTAFGVGGLLAGGTLFFLDWYTAHHPRAEKKTAALSHFSIAPLVSGGAMANVVGRW